MDDLISREAALNKLCQVCGKNCDKSCFRYDGPPYDQIILCPEHYGLSSLPSVQSEFAIPLQWINEYVEKLRQMDNEFANLTASMIETMKNKWCMGQIDKYAEGGEQNG